MTRPAGKILILADGDPAVAALEAALLRRDASVLVGQPSAAAELLERGECDVVVADAQLFDARARAVLESAPNAPWLVAVLAADGTDGVRQAMAAGARDGLAGLGGDAEAAATRILDVLAARSRRQGQQPIREAEAIHRLRQQVREVSERYVRQCRTFDEAQDVFYLDLSRMMTIFDNIMDGIVFTDPEGQITLINPVAELLLGVRAIFAIGRSVRDLGHGELVDEIAKDHERVLIDGGVSERTKEVQRRGRDLGYLKLRTTAVTDYKGAFAGILTVIKDVTAEFKSEQMKNQYLSIVSHELRTPLTGIKTFATLLASGTLGRLPPGQQRVMDSIREQTLRLEREIDKLICLARIESGEFATDLEELSIVGLLEGATAPFALTARERNLAFHVDRPTTNPTVLADREDVRRALQALIENAIKFTPSGGRVDLFVEDNADEVKIHIKDSGPGISPRYHGRIFDKFFQVEDPLTRQHGGAGLGLNVALGVARAHQGRVELVSDLGQGADFAFCLPKIADGGRKPEPGADLRAEPQSGQAVAVSSRKDM